MNLSTPISLPNDTEQLPPWFYPGLLPIETPPPQKSAQPLPEKPSLPPLGGIDLPFADSFSKDCRYLESMYPDLLKRLRLAIREEVEELAQSNSFLYDDYPDKLSLHRLTKRVADGQAELAEEFLKKGCSAEWFEAFVELLFFQQLIEARRRKWRPFYR